MLKRKYYFFFNDDSYKFSNYKYNDDKNSQFGAFTIEVIARCAFGMKIDDLGSDNDPFTKNAKSAFSLPANKTPMVLIPCISHFINFF